MENFDVGLLGILALIVSQVVRSLPTIAIIVGGVIVFRKGYTRSGSVIVASSAVSILVGIGEIVMMRNMEVADYALWYGVGSRVLWLISGGLLAGGILGLILAIPVVPPPTQSPDDNSQSKR